MDINEIKNAIAELDDKSLVWLEESGLKLILIFLILYLLRHFAEIVVRRLVRGAIKQDHFASALDEKKREDTLASVFVKLIKVGVTITAMLIILDEVGVNLAALFAGAGVIGLAIGFGAQSLVADFVSGLFIIVENQYRVGDIIEISGSTGTVESIGIRTTVLRDFDGNQHHIPNGSIQHMINKSKDYSYVNLNVGVGYNSDIKAVQKIVDQVGKNLNKDKELKELIIEAPTFRRVQSLGDSSVEVKIVGKVVAGSQWKVAGELRHELLKAFQKHKIDIPYPQMVVHKTK